MLLRVSSYGRCLRRHRCTFISTSKDIFSNLAMEDVIYNQMKDSQVPVVLLWRNTPCVVIGRHQNPWLETHLLRLQALGVSLARRNSGGGAVYHDEGNLNCTFFTSKEQYTRKRNLEVVCAALKAKWSLDVSVSHRDDIILQQKYKISGTAAKLGRCEAYHHFTLLFDVKKDILSQVLRDPSTSLKDVESKSTRSVGSPVINLCDIEPNINYDSLSEEIVKHLQEHHQFSKPILIEPNESNFPGFDERREQLKSWEWIYGRCPTFTATNTHSTVKVCKGMIEDCSGISYDCKGLRFPYLLSDDNEASPNRYFYEPELINLFPQLF